MSEGGPSLPQVGELWDLPSGRWRVVSADPPSDAVRIRCESPAAHAAVVAGHSLDLPINVVVAIGRRAES